MSPQLWIEELLVRPARYVLFLEIRDKCSRAERRRSDMSEKEAAFAAILNRSSHH